MTVTGSYDDAASAWAAGPARVYARLAAAMLDHSPVPLAGAEVLDVGAGTAVVADAARLRGARWTLASDLAAAMLRQRSPGVAAVVADASRLPLPDGSVDLVAAGFVLSHVSDPAATLTEWRRVGRSLVASAFAPGPPHPAKSAVDEAMTGLGFSPPDWYQAVKRVSDSIEHPTALGELVRAVGFGSVEVTQVGVDAGLDTPDDVVRWRLGMAHLAPWIAGLAAGPREEARAAARRAVADLGPVSIDVLVVSGR